MSGRGVMMARTERSPRRITREIIARSSGSTRPVRSASAIIVRISSSVTPACALARLAEQPRDRAAPTSRAGSRPGLRHGEDLHRPGDDHRDPLGVAQADLLGNQFARTTER